MLKLLKVDLDLNLQFLIMKVTLASYTYAYLYWYINEIGFHPLTYNLSGLEIVVERSIHDPWSDFPIENIKTKEDIFGWQFRRGNLIKQLREGPAKTNLIEEYSIFDMDLKWTWGT